MDGPLVLPAKSLYDTSVYINAIRIRAYYERLHPHEYLALVQRHKDFRFEVI